MGIDGEGERLQSTEGYFSEHSILQMRNEIVAASGNEVFFVGRTDASHTVVEVEVLARGNRDAVPAIIVAAECGDLVIHNHPGGDLTPSRPDLEIASIIGNQGIGFTIIDNSVSRCYEVVAPFVHKVAQLLDQQEIRRFFSPDGQLSAVLKGFEQRDEQLAMALAVCDAFNSERVALIEAGTGTGKSLAYLYPAILWANRNRERVVISTNTINLQEQLIRKDLPFLRQTAGLQFRPLLVKGRSNYLCRRKLATVSDEPSLFNQDRKGELESIIAWSTTSSDGCKSDLGFLPHHELWEDLCCEADQCGRAKCPDYDSCFYYAARRGAAGADILIVNHSLLMTDLAVRQESGDGSGVLPPFSRLIIDEGHHLEEVATNHLAVRFGHSAIVRQLQKLQQPRRADQGLLPLFLSLLGRKLPETHDAEYRQLAELVETVLLPGCRNLEATLASSLDAVTLTVSRHLKDARRDERYLRITPPLLASPLWRETQEKLGCIRESLWEYGRQLQRLLQLSDDLPELTQQSLASLLVDLRGIRSRIQGFAEACDLFCSSGDEICRWYELRATRHGLQLKLSCTPIVVSTIVREVLLDHLKTVVVTSATLAVGEKFDYLKEQTGFSSSEAGKIIEMLLPSPFDYTRQACIGLPTDMPEQRQPGYRAALSAAVARSIEISRGRAFVLCTSYELLTALYDDVKKSSALHGCTLLKQGETDRHRLLSRFRCEEKAVLFGTDSFWEGVDVQGEALELVIITKLPFKVPTEPIQEARAEYVSSRGGDPFRELTIPQAVIKFKQGVGRLIRSRWDRGVVVVLDSRIVTKPYGRSFLKALPAGTVIRGGWSEVEEGLKNFFRKVP